MSDDSFRRTFGERFFDRFWQLNPDWAMSIGYYKYADRLVVPDAASRTETLAQLDRWLRELRGIDPSTLSPAVRADRAMLETEFLAEKWALEELRGWQWNPSNYNVAEPFALLRDLTFAPLDDRLRLFSKRLERVPAYYTAAKANIESPTREHTQLAIDQNRGALAVFGADLEHTLEMSGLSAAERSSFNRRLAAARTAIDDYVRWLEALDARLASGAVAARSFRLGAELYAPKFKYEIQSGDAADRLERVTRRGLVREVLRPEQPGQ